MQVDIANAYVEVLGGKNTGARVYMKTKEVKAWWDAKDMPIACKPHNNSKMSKRYMSVLSLTLKICQRNVFFWVFGYGFMAMPV